MTTQARVDARNAAMSRRQLANLKTARKAILYMSDHLTLTTWTGDHAADILSSRASHRRCSYGVKHTLYYITARDIHGNFWTGTSPPPGIYASMRRLKG